MIDYGKLIGKTTFDMRGIAVQVKAAPYGLVRALLKADGPAAQGDASADIVRACCSVDGEAIDPDQLTASDLANLAKVAMDVNGDNASDFTTPPAPSDSGG